MNNQNIKFITYFILCVLIIFMYGNYRCNNPEHKDILQTSVSIWDLDGWSISHFLFFLFIGSQFPEKNYLLVAVILGILWELFEHYYGEKRPGWLGGDCKKLATDNEDGNWWYAKFSDIIMNILGLLIGYYLKKKKLPFKLPFKLK